MPKINLRLTDEEHEALKVWAQSSHRSLQREAVFRLFANEGATITGEHRTESGGTDVTAPATSVQASGSARESQRSPGHTPFSPDDDALRPPRSSESGLHFKPDFK